MRSGPKLAITAGALAGAILVVVLLGSGGREPSELAEPGAREPAPRAGSANHLAAETYRALPPGEAAVAARAAEFDFKAPRPVPAREGVPELEPPQDPAGGALMGNVDVKAHVAQGANDVIERLEAPRPISADERVQLVEDMYARMMGTADADGDGRLTLAELEADPRVTAIAAALASADTNGDQALDRDELLASSLFAGPPRGR